MLNLSITKVSSNSMTEISTTKLKSQGLTLQQYVLRRTGVPLGASGSLKNMLYRSLGAGTFAGFWQYWNPIWGYSLGKYIYSPLQKFLPAMIALVLTFTISGAIHDLATMLVRGAPAFLFTPWFFFMSIGVIIGKIFKIRYAKYSWAIRCAINLSYIFACLAITLILKALFISM